MSESPDQRAIAENLSKHLEATTPANYDTFMDDMVRRINVIANKAYDGRHVRSTAEALYTLSKDGTEPVTDDMIRRELMPPALRSLKESQDAANS